MGLWKNGMWCIFIICSILPPTLAVVHALIRNNLFLSLFSDLKWRAIYQCEVAMLIWQWLPLSVCMVFSPPARPYDSQTYFKGIYRLDNNPLSCYTENQIRKVTQRLANAVVLTMHSTSVFSEQTSLQVLKLFRWGKRKTHYMLQMPFLSVVLPSSQKIWVLQEDFPESQPPPKANSPNWSRCSLNKCDLSFYMFPFSEQVALVDASVALATAVMTCHIFAHHLKKSNSSGNAGRKHWVCVRCLSSKTPLQWARRTICIRSKPDPVCSSPLFP